MVPIIGLTGGIGCGKSTVAALFADAGVAVIDTDEIVQDLTAAGGNALPLIASRFGPEFVSETNGLERKKMRELVFADEKAREILESVLHPLIQTRVEDALAAVRSAYGIVVVPLFFEKMSYRHLVQRTLVIDCRTETQIARVMQRPGLTRETAEAIVAAQIPRCIRLQLGDDLICNEHRPAMLNGFVHALHKRYLGTAT